MLNYCICKSDDNREGSVVPSATKNLRWAICCVHISCCSKFKVSMGFARACLPNTNACGGVASTALLSAPRSNLMTSSNRTTSEKENPFRFQYCFSFSISNYLLRCVVLVPQQFLLRKKIDLRQYQILDIYDTAHHIQHALNTIFYISVPVFYWRFI